jgi:hypothetical protein
VGQIASATLASSPLPAWRSFASSGGARVLYLIVVIALLCFQPTRAQAHELLGDWQQLTSSAGACPSCRISFSGAASELNVTASNGWSAAVEVREADSGATAAGRGQWSARGPASFASKPFNVDFKLRGERLYMTMVSELANGRKHVVRAVFGRPWLGV